MIENTSFNLRVLVTKTKDTIKIRTVATYDWDDDCFLCDDAYALIDHIKMFKNELPYIERLPMDMEVALKRKWVD